MWSVWPETVDIYLGRGLAMLRLGEQATKVVRSPATAPMAQLLDKLTTELATAAPIESKRMRRRVRLTLSGALCPAIGFVVPSGVTHWRERAELAHAAAAAQLNAPRDQFACAFEPGRAGIAAGLPHSLVQMLHQWAQQVHGRLVVMQPLWSVATNSSASRASGVRGIWLREPDAVTVLARDGGGVVKAQTVLHSVAADGEPVHLRRWLLQQSLTEAQLLKLGFEIAPEARMPDGPKAWAGHWTHL